MFQAQDWDDISLTLSASGNAWLTWWLLYIIQKVPKSMATTAGL